MSTIFKKEGYQVVRGALGKEACELAAIQFRMMRDIDILYKNHHGVPITGDDQVPISFAHYSAYWSESILAYLTDKMSETTGLQLLPTYSYSRIYYKGADLKPHRDRPSCQYSTTLCISQTDPWSIFIRNRAGKPVEVTLYPGDMLVYSGCELEHWREEYTGQELIQTFLHYVDSNGIYPHHIYDRRPMLGMPADTKAPLPPELECEA